MTRMIERWFPCAEVSASSDAGWGSGNQERALFTWFAARPAAQAKAAVICSLLPWPEDPAEQERLQTLVKTAMEGRYRAWTELRDEILKANGGQAAIVDPFSGRGMIPLMAARLGLVASAVDYSPVATMASELLTDYPFRDWSAEPPLPFSSSDDGLLDARPRLLQDVEAFLGEIGRRHHAAMGEFYPSVVGVQPWGYLWAVTLPCQECGRRFPLVASYALRRPSRKPARGGRAAHDDPGQSFYVEPDSSSGAFRTVVHDGSPQRSPTLANAVGANGRKIKGKSATCCFCGHVHPLAVHQRLAQEGLGRDALLVVVSPDERVGRLFREPTTEEGAASERAAAALLAEEPFGVGLPAVPDERIPDNNGATIRPQLYGYTSFGSLMCDRQTLSFVRLCRALHATDRELAAAGLSEDYRRALNGYAAANIVRTLKFSTRGAKMRSTPGAGLLDHIFSNEGTVAFSYDFMESGLSDGPGSWAAMGASEYSTLRGLMEGSEGCTAVRVQRGSATALPYRDATMSAVVTDPPYDSMVYYSDSSDFFYVWLKRALVHIDPGIALVASSSGLQDKSDEIIVKEHGRAAGEHRTREHYDAKIAQAFAEMRRVVRPDGVVTIVFGHGEPEVWQRLLHSMEYAGLVMTGSWPANTESGGQQGKANIETTLTMACRPAPTDRPVGRKGAVEAEIKTEIKRRYPDWERWGLAPGDMLMAASGPAMEVVGRYREILDAKGKPVDIFTFLPLARAAAQDAMAVEINHQPLEAFDARTRFALWWIRLYGRGVQSKGELRWQMLASSLDSDTVKDLVRDADKGVRFVTAQEFVGRIDAESAVIDIALAMAAGANDGTEAMGQVLLDAARGADDTYLWAAIQFLADRLPDNDSDSVAFTRVLRTRTAIGSAAQTAATSNAERVSREHEADAQLKLL